MMFLPRSAPCIRLPSWSRPSPGFSLQSRIRLFLARLREFVWVAASPPRRRRRQVRAPERASRGPWGRRCRGTRGPARCATGRGGAGVYTDWQKRLLGIVLGHSCTLLRRCGQTWGRRSVHRLAKTAPRHRSEAFVYTVATRGSCELRREPRWVARVPQPPWCADGAHSVAVSPLVGKTGSARVAPPLGWRLHRGINPH